MTIASELQALQTNLDNSYTAVSNKGGTLPISQNFDNLSTAISSIPTSVSPVITSLSITPTTSLQTITAPSGTDGYSPITVSAVTSAIDNNIIAGNIKDGVSILGVTGDYTGSTSTEKLYCWVDERSDAGDAYTKSESPSVNDVVYYLINGTYKASTITHVYTDYITCAYASSGRFYRNSSGDIENNIYPEGSLSITTNNTYDVTSYASVTVNVSAPSPTLITKNITANGTYNASSDNADGYSSVTVNVSGGGSSTKYGLSLDELLGDTNAGGVLQAPVGDIDLVFTGVQDIGSHGLENGFYGNTKVKSVSFPNLTAISNSNGLYSTFYNCNSLTSINLSNLATVSGTNAMYSAFSGCTGLTSIDLSGLTTINGSNAMYNTFYDCTGLTSINLSGLTTVSNSNGIRSTFYGCTHLTSVSLPSLTTVSGGSAMYTTFRGCTGLVTADLSAVTTISGTTAMQYAFYGCTNLESIDFSNLQTIGRNSSGANNATFSGCFYNCNKLTTLTFPKLEKIYCTGGNSTSYGTFYRNDKVQKMYFPKLDTITYGSGASSTNQNACKNIFANCTALTEIHFALTNKTAIEATAGYATKWGATNATIYFDL